MGVISDFVNYVRINWENYRSGGTPLEKTRLNTMDAGIKRHNEYIHALDVGKLDLSDAYSMVKDWTMDFPSGVITKTFLDGRQETYNTGLAQMAVNLDYDQAAETFVLTKRDNTVVRIPVRSLMSQQDFADSSVIAFHRITDPVTGNITISAIIPDGAIHENKLQPNFRADCIGYRNDAEAYASAAGSYAAAAGQSAEQAAGSAQAARDWTVGNPSPENETYHNNAKYYVNLAGSSAEDARGYMEDASGYADDAYNYAGSASIHATSARDYAAEARTDCSAASRYADDAERYMEQAGGYADDASNQADIADNYKMQAFGYADNARISAQDAQNWAVGSGIVGEQTYNNNAKYYAEQANTFAQTASASAGEASTSATAAATSATTATTAKETAVTKAGEATESAQSAASSATSASASASTAATKATEAASSASTASTKAGEAETAKNTAVQKASEAATSASTASTKATAASASATAAATSASEASNSASEAADSASSANTYAQQAETSKTGAESAKTAAAGSATSAGTSAQTATTKAGEASTSASNASTSAATATTKASEAATSASNSSNSAKLAESYAKGGTGTRTGENTDNAKYYYQQAKAISESFSGALRPMGTVTFANLPALSSAAEGDMYNVSNQFTTTTSFKEGAGNVIPAGSNVYKTSDGYWDVLAGSPVSGVKGENETTFRKGNVNITASNVGAVSIKSNQGLTEAEKQNARDNIGVTNFSLPDRIGFVAKLINDGDWNDAVGTGWYASMTATNQPRDNVWCIGRTLTHTTDWIIQEAWEFTEGNLDITKVPHYMRIKQNGTWGEWKLVNTISQEGGYQVVDGKLKVKGETDITGHLRALNDFSVSGSLRANGELQVDNQSRFNGTATFNSDVQANASLTVNGTARTKGDLITHSIKPETDNQYNLGNSSKYYKNGYVKSLYVENGIWYGSNKDPLEKVVGNSLNMATFWVYHEYEDPYLYFSLFAFDITKLQPFKTISFSFQFNFNSTAYELKFNISWRYGNDYRIRVEDETFDSSINISKFIVRDNKLHILYGADIADVKRGICTISNFYSEGNFYDIKDIIIDNGDTSFADDDEIAMGAITIEKSTPYVDVLNAKVNGVSDIGNANRKFRNIYATNGTIQTSDRNDKEDIKSLDAEISTDFIMGLKPSSFKMKAGTSGRTHWGLVSQDVEELMDSLNMESEDFAGFIKSPVVDEETEEETGEYIYGLRYDEFIAPLIKVVQAQQQRIEKLEEMTGKE